MIGRRGFLSALVALPAAAVVPKAVATIGPTLPKAVGYSNGWERYGLMFDVTETLLQDNGEFQRRVDHLAFMCRHVMEKQTDIRHGVVKMSWQARGRKV